LDRIDEIHGSVVICNGNGASRPMDLQRNILIIDLHRRTLWGKDLINLINLSNRMLRICDFVMVLLPIVVKGGLLYSIVLQKL